MNTESIFAGTPGPWKRSTNHYAIGPANAGHVIDPFCEMEGPHGDGNPQFEADSRAIAAVPDMIQALQQIIDLPAHPMRKKGFEIARAALAKALGNA